MSEAEARARLASLDANIARLLNAAETADAEGVLAEVPFWTYPCPPPTQGPFFCPHYGLKPGEPVDALAMAREPSSIFTRADAREFLHALLDGNSARLGLIGRDAKGVIWLGFHTEPRLVTWSNDQRTRDGFFVALYPSSVRPEGEELFSLELLAIGDGWPEAVRRSREALRPPIPVTVWWVSEQSQSDDRAALERQQQANRGFAPPVPTR